MLHLSSNIKRIRLLKGLTQSEFGDLVGANKGRIYTYERGLASPDELVKSKIANIANVSIEQLESTDLTKLSVNVLNPDTKEMEYSLTDSKELNELKEMIIRQEQEIKTLKEFIAKLLEKR